MKKFILIVVAMLVACTSNPQAPDSNVVIPGYYMCEDGTVVVANSTEPADSGNSITVYTTKNHIEYTIMKRVSQDTVQIVYHRPGRVGDTLLDTVSEIIYDSSCRIKEQITFAFFNLSYPLDNYPADTVVYTYSN